MTGTPLINMYMQWPEEIQENYYKVTDPPNSWDQCQQKDQYGATIKGGKYFWVYSGQVPMYPLDG